MNNNDDINEFSNPNLQLCHYFIPSCNMALGSNPPYLFVRCHPFQSFFYWRLPLELNNEYYRLNVCSASSFILDVLQRLAEVRPADL